MGLGSVVGLGLLLRACLPRVRTRLRTRRGRPTGASAYRRLVLLPACQGVLPVREGLPGAVGAGHSYAAAVAAKKGPDPAFPASQGAFGAMLRGRAFCAAPTAHARCLGPMRRRGTGMVTIAVSPLGFLAFPWQ